MKRMFPSYTTTELEQRLNGSKELDPVVREKIEIEVARRKAGFSTPFFTPQVPPPTES